MNPAYFRARLRVETVPGSGIPGKFVVITACNPEGKVISDEENVVRTEALRASLVERGMRHFAVDGYDPD